MYILLIIILHLARNHVKSFIYKLYFVYSKYVYKINISKYMNAH
jgi:hypothetical protein